VVDDYFGLLDGLETAIEAIDEEVIESTDRDLLEEINAGRRDPLAFREVVWSV